MERTESNRNRIEMIFVGFGLSLTLIGVLLILLLNDLPLGLLCFGIGVVVFYLLLSNSRDSHTKGELEINEIDHAQEKLIQLYLGTISRYYI